MTVRQTILVVGVSGVGKTTACRMFTSEHPEFIYVSASAILINATGLTSEQLRSTDEHNIVLRQREIENYVVKMKADLPLRSFIIDGHAVIDNGKNFIDIPLSTVQAIAPNRIVHLSLDPILLLARRCADNRPRPSRNSKELSQYQNLSEERALYLSRSLMVPCHIISGDSSFTLSNFDLKTSKYD